MASDEAKPKKESTARLEAISDGLFAVALTLIILDIKVPHLPEGQVARLPSTLWRMAPLLGIYAASFLVVGFYWISHNLMFATIHKSDRRLLWLNLLYLLCIAFLPFATQLLAEYPKSHASVIFYGGDACLVGLMQLAVWLYATRNHRLIDPAVTDNTLRAATQRLALMPLASLLDIVLSVVSPVLSIAIYALTPMLYVLTGARNTIVEHKE